MGRYADAHIAVNEHDPLLADDQGDGQRQTFPAQNLHRVSQGRDRDDQGCSQPKGDSFLHGVSP